MTGSIETGANVSPNHTAKQEGAKTAKRCMNKKKETTRAPQGPSSGE